MPDEIVICAAKRTPIGAFLGAFSAVPATELGAVAVRAVLEDSGIDPARIDEVLMGCVLPAGLGQAPARQAALKAGIPTGVPCTTVNKMCGSGMKALMLGFDQIRAGAAEVVVAGGMESMSRAPYLVSRAQRMGHARLLDHILYDGLEDPESGELMGFFAEQCADRFRFTRQQQDAYAAESVRRSLAAIADGAFHAEIVPVEVKGHIVSEDEGPGRCDLTRIARLKPAFRKGRGHGDRGQCLQHLGRRRRAPSDGQNNGREARPFSARAHPRARHGRPGTRGVHDGTHRRHPAAPRPARMGPGGRRSLRDQRGLRGRGAGRDPGARAPARACQRGACALGHPIGATGARILVTLLHALRARGEKRGIASLCIGGGEATALAIEC
jgi:acetyl-CoA C-acetyltransferase